jgi:hypothetical protein
VRLTRTTLAFTMVVQVRHAFDDCRKALRSVELDRCGILLDWRAPAMTTNPELHKAIVQHTDAFAARFVRRAILVGTPVGQMQVARIGRQHSDAAAPALFNDEAAAIAHVAWHASTPEVDAQPGDEARLKRA